MNDLIKKFALVAVVAAFSVGALAAGGKAPSKKFTFKGYYVEGCSCPAPCPCELTGVSMSCEGVGFFTAQAGSKFEGADMSGARMAYATKPGEWVMIFIDAPTAAKRKAIEAFSRAALGAFGKIEAVKNAKVVMSDRGGNFTASIDGGKVCDFKSEVVKGGDNKTPLVYSNIHDPVHPTVMQGKTVSGNYNDGTHKFDLKDSNAYFNSAINSKGSL